MGGEKGVIRSLFRLLLKNGTEIPDKSQSVAVIRKKQGNLQAARTYTQMKARFDVVASLIEAKKADMRGPDKEVQPIQTGYPPHGPGGAHNQEQAPIYDQQSKFRYIEKLSPGKRVYILQKYIEDPENDVLPLKRIWEEEKKKLPDVDANPDNPNSVFKVQQREVESAEEKYKEKLKVLDRYKNMLNEARFPKKSGVEFGKKQKELLTLQQERESLMRNLAQINRQSPKPLPVPVVSEHIVTPSPPRPIPPKPPRTIINLIEDSPVPGPSPTVSLPSTIQYLSPRSSPPHYDFQITPGRDAPPPSPPRRGPDRIPEHHPDAHLVVAPPRVNRRIDIAAFGEPSEDEKKEEVEALDAVGPIRGVDPRNLQYHRFIKQVSINPRNPPQRTYHVQPTMIHGSYHIPDSAYEEIVYVQPPPRGAYNNRFLNINPTSRFVNKFKNTDPIHGSHSHYWSKLGDYVQISAKARSIHIRFLKKNIPEKAIQILIARLVEHTQSNQIVNPRLLNVQKRGKKKVLSMMLDANQLRTGDDDYIANVFRNGMKRSMHFILKQDNVGGIFHDRISNDDILL